MKIPTVEKAGFFLAEAEQNNPGKWVQHSINTAKAAEIIASFHPQLDSISAYVLGLLHDIGRRGGVMGMRHIYEGFQFLNQKGYEDAARICLTHSFLIQDVYNFNGKRDCTKQEMEFLDEKLSELVYNDYDRLIQLCDILADATGFCLLEKRLIDVYLRHGVNEHTVDKIKALMELKDYFERYIGNSVYTVLAGVMENTFGLNHEEFILTGLDPTLKIT